MICKYCGRQITDDAEYCSYCGRKVLRVPPVFTMTDIGTGIATEAIRSYSEWGFYNNPDADLDPETGRRRETEFDTLKTLPDENPLKWARDFMEADAAEAAAVSGATDEMDAENADEEDYESEEEEETLDEEYEEDEKDEDDEDDDNDENDDDEGEIEEEEAAPKRRVPIAVIIIALVLLAAAVAGGAYLLFGGDKTYEVDLNAIMNEPKVIGYDGYGEMALMPQIDNAKADEWLKTVEFDNDKEAFTKVLKTVKYTPDKTKDLSNGDVVNITIEYDKNLAAEKKLKVKAEPTTYEVNGLEIGKDLAYDKDAYHAYYDDFILPESDRVMLTKEDVAYSTDGSADLTQQAINEIYARHGYIFGNEHYDKLFRGFEWYVPMYEPEKFDESWLNEFEKANLNLLTNYRNELKAAAKKAAEEKAAQEAAKKAAEEAAKTKQSTQNTTKPSN